MSKKIGQVSRGGALFNRADAIAGILILTVPLLQTGVAHADPDYTVSGTLTVNSIPIPDATITLTNGESATTDSDGNYSIDDVPTGGYTVSMSYRDTSLPTTMPYDMNVSSRSDSYLEVTGDTTENLSFETDAQAMTVKDADGSPVADTEVNMATPVSDDTYFSDGTDGEQFIGMVYAYSSTDSEGDTTVPVFQSVIYDTCVSPTSGQYCENITASTTPITVTLPPVVSGTLTVNSVAIPDATITLTNGESATTDSSGNYSLGYVPAGGYFVSVSYDDPSLPTTVPYEMHNVTSRSDNYLEVSGNTTENLSFETNGQVVAVEDSNGNPVADTEVDMATLGGVYFSDGTDGEDFNGSVYAYSDTDSSGDVTVPVFQGPAYSTCVADVNGSDCQNVTASSTPVTLVEP